MVTTRCLCIVLRHGETTWNRDGRFQGHLDSPLTERGEEQSRALARRLAGHRFAALYSSDLGRASRTAEIVAATTGHSVLLDARLRERHLGVLQGLTRAEGKERFPEAYRLFKMGGPDEAVPGGESTRQRFDCALACFQDLVARHAGETIVAITHGGVVSGLFRHVLAIPLEAPRRFLRRNAAWNVFRWEDGKWFVDTFGDISHLAGAGLDDL
jgi:2,3-bisphosphoglycerate-dependent phosphoglycerate mutase